MKKYDTYKDFDSAALDNIRANGGGTDHLERTLEQIAEECDLDYVFSLAPHWKQNILFRIGGGNGHRGNQRTFEIALTKDAKKRMKGIGLGLKIMDLRGREIDWSKKQIVPAQTAIALFRCYSEHAENKNVRGLIQEVTATEQ